MEKRTLLAIALSLLILYVWSTLFPPPKSNKNIPQTIENKQVVENQDTVSKISPVTQKPPTVPPSSEQIKSLKNAYLTAEFSNIGGNLKKMTIEQDRVSLPVTSFLNVAEDQDTVFVLESISDQEIVYSGALKDHKVIKKYKIEDKHTIRAVIEIVPTAKMSTLDILIGVFMLDMSNLESKVVAQEKSLLEYSVAMPNNIARKHDAFHFNSKEKKQLMGPVDWIGFRDKYFALLIKPVFHVNSHNIDPIDESHLKINLTGAAEDGRFEFLIYAGPQNIQLLKKYGQGFENIVAFSNFSLIDVIAKSIYWLIIFFHKVIPSWGICIILISLVVYGATYPLTVRGMYSMKRMQAIQPEMNVLREKYKNNPQRLNKEVVELYKKYKVNPFGGCFLLILQMPVFIALYQVLWRSEFFNGQSFLWIKDLAAPDRLMIFSFNIPVLGNELNILPILMAIVMFFQQKISMQNMVTTDPNQMLQQKMMAIMMPVLIGFVFYKFASGVALYFTMFYLLSTLTQIKMSRQKVTVV
ncbi:MAG: hypothetical protein A2787_01640 [Omnitrophica WOR_2 bacterium RIFCSPHIGHO2_01_FULL_48_9]|nr:MAG: hypothetical protein A2787_01640 [Omnitrophica WOR_2 bacterium RIFCSPHIGHO2_01_FULL_48_9]